MLKTIALFVAATAAAFAEGSDKETSPNLGFRESALGIRVGILATVGATAAA